MERIFQRYQSKLIMVFAQQLKESIGLATLVIQSKWHENNPMVFFEGISWNIMFNKSHSMTLEFDCRLIRSYTLLSSKRLTSFK